MDEYLKTLRFAHRLILIYAGTLLLLSLSPNPVFRYEQARKELMSLQKFDYDRFVSESIDEWNLVALADEPGCSDNKPYASDKRAFFDSLTQSHSPVLSQTVILFPTPNPSVSTVQEHLTFLGNDVFVEFCVTGNTIVDAVNRCRGDLESLDNRNLTSIQLEFGDEQFERMEGDRPVVYRVDYSSLKKWGFESPENDPHFDAFSEFVDRHPELFRITLTFQGPDSSLVMPILPLVKSPNQGLTPAKTALTLFDRNPQTAADALPFSFAILDEIKVKPIADAIRYLDRRIIEDKNHPTIYGVKIDSKYALIAVPIVGLGLYIFLLMHILGTRQVAERIGGDLDFPSLLFYQGPGMQSIRWFTIVLLPLVPFQFLVVRLGNPLNTSSLIAEGISLGTVIVAYSCYGTVNSFQVDRPVSNEESQALQKRCEAKTSSGKACSRFARAGTKYCWQHSNSRD